MVSTYNIKKIKSCGLMYFEFDIDSLKKYLQTKFKYVFEEEDADIIPKDPNPLDGEPDYKKLFQEQQEEIYRLKQEIKELESKKNKSKVKIEEPKQELTDEDLELELSLLSK
jgi:uncharacterized protein YlxW (UPF0749 family)